MPLLNTLISYRLTAFPTVCCAVTYVTQHSLYACSSLKAAGFPVHLLPRCVQSGGVAGHTCSDWHGIPAGTPVGAALGDFQCSVYSCMSARTDAGEAETSSLYSPSVHEVTVLLWQSKPAIIVCHHIWYYWFQRCWFLSDVTVLNISTSAQLTYAMPADFRPPDSPQPASSISYFPYFKGSYLAVAASLNGGNVLATFVEMLGAWMKELGVCF